ncbi:MAG: hypothetical protein ACAH80_05025 [Alphaproteobacteria bacterium]
MTVEHYAGTKNLPIDPEHQMDFDVCVAGLKNLLREHGISREATQKLNFTLTRHTLEISAEEGRSGAFHIHAGGTPFYALTVTAPGSIFQLAGNDMSGPLAQQKPEAQALLLGVELGMNIMGNMNRVLTEYYGQKDDRVAGGVGGPVGECKYETTFRCEPMLYMQALLAVTEIRLKTIAPKSDIPPKPEAVFRIKLKKNPAA